jgi:GNAT superfamily N-acetyltransferase
MRPKKPSSVAFRLRVIVSAIGQPWACLACGTPIFFDADGRCALDRQRVLEVTCAFCGAVSSRLLVRDEPSTASKAPAFQLLIIRQIRPEDRGVLRRGFAALSSESHRRRFCGSTPCLSGSALRRFTNVDHRDREALVALTPDGRRLVGTAEYVRLVDHPRLAELGVLVLDEWQRRGIGTALLDGLGQRARAAGVERFCAYCLAGNWPARRLLSGHGLHPVASDAGIVELAGPVGVGGAADAAGPRAAERTRVPSLETLLANAWVAPGLPSVSGAVGAAACSLINALL